MTDGGEEFEMIDVILATAMVVDSWKTVFRAVHIAVRKLSLAIYTGISQRWLTM
jgi:hypothetical protein